MFPGGPLGRVPGLEGPSSPKQPIDQVAAYCVSGLVVGPVGWSGDELGEMLQQGRLPADAVLGTQAPVGQLANLTWLKIVDLGPVGSC
jgi:hypothetical protein